MGVSKVVLVDPNTQTPEILMDVTGDDTSADVLLAGNVGTRNDGEKVTGNIPEKTSSDLTVSGATVTAPSGHYASSASATVASGTAGTPTATKGSVSNHSVNVTPSVTNTTGYISGGTKTGTPVSVSASELVSGTKSIAANGTGIDVTNYASVDVDVPPTPLQTKSVTPTESAQTVTPDSGYALSEVDISAIPSDYVGSAIDRRDSTDLSLNIEVSGVTVTAPAGYYDETASKSIPEGSVSNPDITVASDGMITVTQTSSPGYIRGGSATYRKPLSTQSGKTVSPTESEQTAVAAGKYTTGEVKVGAIPSDYVGSGVTRRTASDLTKSGALVFAPAGYYAEQVGKSVDYGSQGAPSISVDSDGLITASATDTTGYITGTTKTATEQLSTQAAATITPSETAQTAVAAGKYTTGAVTVDAIPSDYVGSAIDQRDSSDLTASGATVTAPAGYYEEAASKAVASGSATAPASISGTSATVTAGTNTLTLSKTVSVTPSVTPGYISSGTAGNSSVSLTASVTTKAAATITPGTSNQTIAAGTYLTGAQTIAGSANLVAGNIKSGVNIFGKVGTFAGDATVYKDAWTSRSAPVVDTSIALSLHREPTSIVSGTAIGDYALIGPYMQANYLSGTSSESNEVIYIDKHLSMGYAPAASVKVRGGAGAATIGNYALFAGGYSSTTGNSYKVQTYTASLTHGTASDMTFYGSEQNGMPTAVVGNYAIFLPDYNSNIAGNAYNTSLTRSNVTAPSQIKRGPGVTVGNYALFGPIGTGYPNTDVYNTSLTRSTATQMTTPRGSSGAVAVGNYALFVAGYGSTQLTNTEYYTNTLTHGVVSAACEKHITPACGTVGNYAIIASGITYGAGTVEYYTNTLTHATVGTNVLPQTYSTRAVNGCVLYGYVFTLGCGNDAINTIKVPYNLAVSVPASYTYTFNGETPTTVSSATSVTKTSGAPISGVICKAATTKTGQVT